MSLSPGEPWGELANLPADAPIVDSDRALAALIDGALGTPLTAGLTAGDLCRTLGGRGDVAQRAGRDTTIAPIDTGQIWLDGEPPATFVAHVVARGPIWGGEGLVIMNAEWLGTWRMAPRAHPGDGLFDIVSGQMPLRQRVLARARLRLGEHLPHPALKSSRTDRFAHTFAQPRRIYIDGSYVGNHIDIRVTLNPSTVRVAV